VPTRDEVPGDAVRKERNSGHEPGPRSDRRSTHRELNPPRPLPGSTRGQHHQAPVLQQHSSLLLYQHVERPLNGGGTGVSACGLPFCVGVEITRPLWCSLTQRCSVA